MSNAVISLVKQKSDLLSDVFGVNAPPSAKIPVPFGPGSNIKRDRLYVFPPKLLKKANMWFSGALGEHGKGLYIFGDTGCGKTMFASQYAAALEYPFYLIGMHNRLEFNETLGNFQLVQVEQSEPDEIPTKGGVLGILSFLAKIANAIKALASSGVKTRFVDGLLGRALRSANKSKVILCLDEMDQCDPSQLMAFNQVMDGYPVGLPTGEVIDPKNIWFIATGNTKNGDARGVYKGAKPLNAASKSRWALHLKLDYSSPEVEEVILAKAEPGMHVDMRKKLIEFAGEMRKLFASCDIDVPLATRTLIFWAKESVLLNGTPDCSPIREALIDTFANQCTDEDYEKVMGAWDRFEENATTNGNP